MFPSRYHARRRLQTENMFRLPAERWRRKKKLSKPWESDMIHNVWPNELINTIFRHIDAYRARLFGQQKNVLLRCPATHVEVESRAECCWRFCSLRLFFVTKILSSPRQTSTKLVGHKEKVFSPAAVGSGEIEKSWLGEDLRFSQRNLQFDKFLSRFRPEWREKFDTQSLVNRLPTAAFCGRLEERRRKKN